MKNTGQKVEFRWDLYRNRGFRARFWLNRQRREKAERGREVWWWLWWVLVVIYGGEREREMPWSGGGSRWFGRGERRGWVISAMEVSVESEAERER